MINSLSFVYCPVCCVLTEDRQDGLDHRSDSCTTMRILMVLLRLRGEIYSYSYTDYHTDVNV